MYRAETAGAKKEIVSSSVVALDKLDKLFVDDTMYELSIRPFTSHSSSHFVPRAGRRNPAGWSRKSLLNGQLAALAGHLLMVGENLFQLGIIACQPLYI